jgi:predicted RNA binding protein YcfA (HicA-like mRNA interferase family)
MGNLPRLSGREAVKVFEKFGGWVFPLKGSQMIMPTHHTLCVPINGGTIRLLNSES